MQFASCDSLSRANPRADCVQHNLEEHFVLVDDGGHRMHQLMAGFRDLYPHPAIDGVYLCEVLHTCCMKNYGVGYRQPESFLERSKGRIDQLNAGSSEEIDLAAAARTVVDRVRGGRLNGGRRKAAMAGACGTSP